jgi:hypothetical protein
MSLLLVTGLTMCCFCGEAQFQNGNTQHTIAPMPGAIPPMVYAAPHLAAAFRRRRPQPQLRCDTELPVYDLHAWLLHGGVAK